MLELPGYFVKFLDSKVKDSSKNVTVIFFSFIGVVSLYPILGYYLQKLGFAPVLPRLENPARLIPSLHDDLKLILCGERG